MSKNCSSCSTDSDKKCTTSPVGPTGPTGPKGVTGPRGFHGVTGPEGVTGLTGAEGCRGCQGPVGPQGPEGPKGETGVSNITTYTEYYTAEAGQVVNYQFTAEKITKLIFTLVAGGGGGTQAIVVGTTLVYGLGGGAGGSILEFPTILYPGDKLTLQVGGGGLGGIGDVPATNGLDTYLIIERAEMAGGVTGPIERFLCTGGTCAVPINAQASKGGNAEIVNLDIAYGGYNGDNMSNIYGEVVLPYLFGGGAASASAGSDKLPNECKSTETSGGVGVDTYIGSIPGSDPGKGLSGCKTVSAGGNSALGTSLPKPQISTGYGYGGSGGSHVNSDSNPDLLNGSNGGSGYAKLVYEVSN